jgi:hypothetical protein
MNDENKSDGAVPEAVRQSRLVPRSTLGGNMAAREDLKWLFSDETKSALGAAYARLAQAVCDAGRKLIPRCGKRDGYLVWRAGDSCVWVRLSCYSSKSFRLSTLGAWYYFGHEHRAPYAFELSFAPEEIGEVAQGFVRFSESVFTSGGNKDLFWLWPLFARDPSYPHYAWTALGQQRENRVFVIRQAREKKHVVMNTENKL